MSKKVKVFEEKQRELTDAEITALNHLKSQGDFKRKKLKDEVLTPEKAKLQDVVLSDEERNILKEYEKGKIITPDMLQKEEDQEREEERLFQEEFLHQLTTWIAQDHHSEYEWVDFDHDDYLVRLFNMDVSKFDKFRNLAYEWSAIHGNYKLKDVPATENVFPIVKILKVGAGIKSKKYKVGDICLVPSTDVIGEDWNPQFLHVMQFQKSQNMKPIIPDGMRQSIPNVEKNWEKYKFVRPWVVKPQTIDHLTYLIPEPKIRGTYNRK